MPLLARNRLKGIIPAANYKSAGFDDGVPVQIINAPNATRVVIHFKSIRINYASFYAKSCAFHRGIEEFFEHFRGISVKASFRIVAPTHHIEQVISGFVFRLVKMNPVGQFAQRGFNTVRFFDHQAGRQELEAPVITVGGHPGRKRLSPGYSGTGGQENKKEEKFNPGMNHSVDRVCEYRAGKRTFGWIAYFVNSDFKAKAITYFYCKLNNSERDKDQSSLPLGTDVSSDNRAFRANF